MRQRFTFSMKTRFSLLSRFTLFMLREYTCGRDKSTMRSHRLARRLAERVLHNRVHRGLKCPRQQDQRSEVDLFPPEFEGQDVFLFPADQPGHVVGGEL